MASEKTEAMRLRMLAAEAREREWEKQMDERIVTESMQIREEWDEQTRLSRLVCKRKRIEWQVPRVHQAGETPKGIDFT
jgi:hypothetical protein